MDKLTLGQRMADGAAATIGSWRFIIGFNSLLLIWVLSNALSHAPIDPFPFILLNLMLSWLAGVQAPLIMISQNRQEEIAQGTLVSIRQTQHQLLAIMESIQVILSEQREHLLNASAAGEELADNVEAIMDQIGVEIRDLEEHGE